MIALDARSAFGHLHVGLDLRRMPQALIAKVSQN